MGSTFTESVVEDATLEWFESLGYTRVAGPSLAPGEPGEERKTYGDVVLEGRLRDALRQLNPSVPPVAIDEAARKLVRITSPQLVDANHELHHYLVNGVAVEYLREDGTIGYDPIRVLDYDEPDNNEWLAINQYTVVEAGRTRRPDVVVFVNGLPLAVIELKNAADEDADIWHAFHQLQTYKAEIPSLFVFNELLVTPTASKRAWARSRRTASGSRRGGRSRARTSRRPSFRSARVRGADRARQRQCAQRASAARRSTSAPTSSRSTTRSK